MLTMFFQQTVGGLAAGSMYAIMAVAYSLIYASMRAVNWAQGEFFMLGAYLGVTAWVHWKWPLPVAFLLAAVVMYVYGAVVHRVAVRPAVRGGDLTLLMITIGVSIASKQLAVLIWGPVGERFPSIVGDVPVRLGAVALVPDHMFVLGSGVVLTAVLYLFLFRTRLGLAMRAVAQSRYVAEAMGVDADRVDLHVFGLSGLLAAVAGTVMGPLIYVEPGMGGSIGMKGFVAAVLGGFGDVRGSVLGGLLLGLVEGFVTMYVSSGYKDAIAFGVLIAALLIRPQGLVGRQVASRA